MLEIVKHSFTQILILTTVSTASYPQQAFQRIEIETSAGCKYAEYVPNEWTSVRIDIRKQSKVTWSGRCSAGYINGFGSLNIEGLDGSKQEFRATYEAGLENGSGESILFSPTGVTKFFGQWRNGARVYGKVEYAGKDGRKWNYEGQFLDEKFHGRGVYVDTLGTVDEGYFISGRLEGPGIRRQANGRIYEANFKEGVITGNGKLTLPSGEVRTGTFLHDYLSGPNGTIKYPNGDFYSGELHYDLPSGVGKLTYRSGATYEGNFSAGKPDGLGVLKRADGGIYEGSFKSGQFEGQGILKTASGLQFDGNFSEGKLNGLAKTRDQSGVLGELTYLAGVQQGWARFTYPNGVIAEGNYLKGKPDGKWVVSNPAGMKYELEYRDGVEVSRRTIQDRASASAEQSNSPSVRQRGIDSMNCEMYAKQNTSDQRVDVGPVTRGGEGLAFLSGISQAYVINRNRQSFYDSCMKRLGY